MSRSISPDTHRPQESPSQLRDETCPACVPGESNALNSFEKERWVRCDACKTWYHWRCVGQGDDIDGIDKWFCQKCIEEKPSRTITRKAPTRKSSRKRTQRDYANLDSGVSFDPARWPQMLEEKDTKGDPFRRMHGGDLGLPWLEKDETAMREPIVIEKPDGLGMKMPSNTLTVDDVAELVGEDTPVEVIDVTTQSTAPGWTLEKWAEYMELEPEKRDKILNVISLEISSTKLADMILPPRLVRDLDWVENYWPITRKGKGHAYPKVQLYCLMGVATAWTDWHIDFAGSSVYYHILRGSKIFYFIRPTPANLLAYERWSGTELQYQSWLGDMVDEVYKVELKEGNTMIIPSGWIHAVYTPVDTMVFGGNFLHSYSIQTQLRVRNIEIATSVPKKFRFPLFSKLCWYVGDKYLRDLKIHSEPSFSPRLLASLAALAEFLVSEVRVLEHGADAAKKEVKEQIPTDRVKDAPAVARELRWRLRLVAGSASDDEGSKKAERTNGHTNGIKRRRVESEGLEDGTLRFRNFKPRVWDRIEEKVEDLGTESKQATQPGTGDGWADTWIDPDDRAMNVTEGDQDAQVVHQRTVIVKVRKTAKGLERQRIERTVEQWLWHGGE
ncbi:jumonji superfamily protein [Macrolepiota fuliginosa MF-IS2]|uniref:JmjC domain-containing histone demethylation protein 1 n=1 Tax=Macrolepiota fuliginosa MF-IS2 TaxID=1400762 RepID=A0A9P5XPD2_9AGAR|nr:jumonji superfamily protein [Macrolepiota fuliginosa MF-IS2]